MTKIVRLQTNHGNIDITLNEKKAPITCKNFESYVTSGFYDGTLFHRVIKSFMIQGGGMDTSFAQKDTLANIENEANNGLLNNAGTIAMARTQDPHSASSQFFINCKDNAFLNFKAENLNGWGYCVFGEVTKGMDVVEKIEQVATTNRSGHADVPRDDVIIEKATMLA